VEPIEEFFTNMNAPLTLTTADGTPLFQEFPKIPRLSRDIRITEKIDGTNACVVVPEDPAALVIAQSRNRFIYPEDDNYGFALWVQQHSDELRGLGPGRHFGEWWGLGIQRGYGLSERRFSLFNVSRWNKELWETNETTRLLAEQLRWHRDKEKGKDVARPEARVFKPAPACCHVVPVLWTGIFDSTSITTILQKLELNGSEAAPGFTDPEGIVIFHTASRHLYKKTVKDDEKSKGDA
jgi:hypothetical protein